MCDNSVVYVEVALRLVVCVKLPIGDFQREEVDHSFALNKEGIFVELQFVTTFLFCFC